MEPVGSVYNHDARLIAVLAVILASPAFSVSYRETFLEFRGKSLFHAGFDRSPNFIPGEWALIAFWATMSLSVGSTNL